MIVAVGTAITDRPYVRVGDGHSAARYETERGTDSFGNHHSRGTVAADRRYLVICREPQVFL